MSGLCRGTLPYPRSPLPNSSTGLKKAQPGRKIFRQAFLLPLEIASFDAGSALAYGKIRAMLERQSTPIGGMDMLIAAQAIAQGFTLITHNVKEFARV
ncbi:PIN domain-containing protein, partial [Desulfovibrio sp. OH1186_COT-070]|uniref:PIN domain-containing protein n=1 Tax=unclassified Desulfovibrio TaxID=2593640 RepID=UPI003908B916